MKTEKDFDDLIKSGNFTKLSSELVKLAYISLNKDVNIVFLEKEVQTCMNDCVLNHIKANYPEYFAQKLENLILEECLNTYCIQEKVDKDLETDILKKINQE